MKSISKAAKEKQREARKEAGFFDGRFKPKVIKDKKKEAVKFACRKFKLKKQ
jgi:hypothetical protein